ncbi:MAG: hypothetical protein EPN85_14165 [Bacteroidetes bacterium]|nr:MAG: hypothetical protein EPN85_14165 [Bacteroidota bacterium]
MKSKISCLTTAIFLFSLAAFAQQPANSILMTIGNEKVTVDDFLAVYKKNNNKDGTPLDKKSMEEYLNLYTVFRLKVKEAKDMGIDTSKSFRDELSGYRKTLAQPYLSEKEVIDNMVKEVYDRMHWDIRTSHILVKLEADPAPEDTLEAYMKAALISDFITKELNPAGLKKYETTVRTNLKISKTSSPADTLAAFNKLSSLRNMMKLKTHSFSHVAAAVSDHPSKTAGGDVGYLTGLTGQGFPYEYENIAYSAKTGVLVGPVRSSMGYHLIQVTDKRAHKELHVAHLMLQFKKGMSKDDSTKLKAKIDSVSGLLKQGDNYEDLAKKISDHKETGKKGGDIGWLSISSNFPPDFKDAVFKIHEDGMVSPPVQTRFGWHIVKRLGTRELPAFDSLKADIKTKVQQDARSLVAKEKMISKIKMQYQFKEISKRHTDFYAVVDSTISMGLWTVSKAKDLTKPMFTLLDKTFTQQDFAAYIEKNHRLVARISPRRIVDALYKKFVDESCMNFKESRLEQEFPDFRILMDEYRDGILLFNLTDQKVWTKAIKDTTGAKEYHEKFKEHFMWDDRADASIFSCKDEKTAEKVKKLIRQNKSDMEILSAINKDTVKYVSVESKVYFKGESPMLDAANWNIGVTPNESIKGKVVFANIKKVVKSTPKTYAESKGLVTSEYQAWLEKEWVDSLKKKYPVSIDRKVFDSIK